MHWLLAVTAGWLLVAVVLALLLGRIIRQADRRESAAGKGTDPLRDVPKPRGSLPT